MVLATVVFKLFRLPWNWRDLPRVVKADRTWQNYLRASPRHELSRFWGNGHALEIGSTKLEIDVEQKLSCWPTGGTSAGVWDSLGTWDGTWDPWDSHQGHGQLNQPGPAQVHSHSLIITIIMTNLPGIKMKYHETSSSGEWSKNPKIRSNCILPSLGFNMIRPLKVTQD